MDTSLDPDTLESTAGSSAKPLGVDGCFESVLSVRPSLVHAAYSRIFRIL